MAALPRTYSTPLEEIDRRLGELRDIADRLIQADERHRLLEIELRKELQMRDDAIDAFRKQIADKDAFIGELQERRSR